jgi:uncharacterized membrane protein YeaQ/YmgE (transglycosylase-associated protein family)
MTIGLFWTIFAGLIGGILVNGFRPMARLTGMKGILALCGIGVAGALAASLAGQVLHLWGQEEIGAFLAAVVGAAALLGVISYFSDEAKPVPLAP